MRQKLPSFQWQITAGEPYATGTARITPLARSLTVRWRQAGWVWARPAAVLVERDGRTERVPVPDWTRRIQFGLLGAGLFAALIARIGPNRDRRLRP